MKNWLEQKPYARTTDSLVQTQTNDYNRAQFTDKSISEIVDKISPSVVSIVTSSSVRSFFGNTESSGAGTGVIVTKNGYVLTNKHVIASANKIMAVTSSGDTYEDVRIVFQDPLNDLAILKIETKDANFLPIEIGDSKTIKVGQAVIAVGNSLGQYQNTVTRGIISGVGRSITAQGNNGMTETLTDMLQTDAAINSGNSGGPLVNAGGQLIGINTAVAQDANSLGFAIPIGAAKGLLKQLASGKDIQRAMLGVRFTSINPAIAKQQNLSEKQGALIASDPGSNTAAADAGIKKDDIILQVNDYVVGKDGGLNTLISEYQPGDKVNLKIKRGNSVITLEVILRAANNVTA
ncbi:MAG: trypsin-like peptidase domain-containing protein [Candidatus Saccharibacteria bacterium]|nr:trypsin-like peptidase domain-containing protein [Candidatus Saccharibacteria bacterium]